MRRTLAILGPLLLLGLWGMLTEFHVIESFFFPGPKATVAALLHLLSSNLHKDIIATVVRALQAFGIAAIVGVPFGLLLGKNEKVYRSIEFIIDFFRSMPATALFPLFLLIFGIGSSSKVAVAAFGALLIIMFNTAYGVIHSKKIRILAAKLMGASQWQMFKWIIFWESLPQTFVGLRNGISLTLAIVVVTEMFIGTDVGLGRRIIDSQIVFNIPAMYAAIIMTGVVGYLLNYALLQAEQRVVHWTKQ